MFKDLFRRRPAPLSGYHTLEVDIHSHFIPGIDDGAKSMDESLMLLEKMQELGFRKVITTPHIMSDFYRNTPEIIREGLQKLREAAKAAHLSIEIEAAAEYNMDEGLAELLDNKKELLTFGDRYLLFELSFVNQPPNLFDIIFKMQVEGYKPVLAHPERYPFLYGNMDGYKKIKSTGVLFILNTISLTGYYGSAAKQAAHKLIDNNMVDMLASDTHHNRHIFALKNALSEPYLAKVLASDLRNPSL